MRNQVTSDRVKDGHTLIVRVRRKAVLGVIKLERQRGKVALAHGSRKNTCCALASLVFACGLIVGEEEQLVPENRAADGASENGLGKRVLGYTREIVGPGVCGRVLIFLHPVAAAVKCVATALENRNHIAAVYVAIGGRRIGLNHTQLLNGVGRRIVANQVVLGFVDVGAIEGVVVSLRAIAVNGDHV